MNFLNVGPWELSLILVIAILMIGPKRMVEIVRTIGRISAQIRKMSNEFMGAVQTEFGAVEKETRQAVNRAGAPLSEPLTGLISDIKTLGQETAHALGEISADVGNVVAEEQKAAEEKRGE